MGGATDSKSQVFNSTFSQSGSNLKIIIQRILQNLEILVIICKTGD